MFFTSKRIQTVIVATVLGLFADLSSSSSSCRFIVPVVGFMNVNNFQRKVVVSPVSTSAPTSTSTTRTTAGSTSKLFAIPQLDKWKLLPNGSVVGTVTNHPSIEDGDVITTSPLANPDNAKAQALVLTASGSRYKLLDPIRPPPAPKNDSSFSSASASSAASSSSSSSSTTTDGKVKKGSPEWREAVMNFKLTQATIGLEEEYLLAGKPIRSTSGKSNIWEAYKAGYNGLPAGDGPVCIKVSANLEAVSREYENYRKLSFLGIARGRFVKCYEFFPVAGYDKRFRNQCALVLERGARDLKSYLTNRKKLEGKELRDACISAAQCLQALHGVGLVWTDLKTENFVVMPDGEVKGIDLESAMPVGDNPVDYSPEACPPEFAEAFLVGDGPYFQLDTSYDIWSLGMLMMELATGRGYFDGKNPAQITKILRDMNDDISLDNVDCDERLKDLIKRCLRKDPRTRPNMAQILLHPYFIAGPFAFFGA